MKEKKRTVSSISAQYRDIAKIDLEEMGTLDKCWMQVGVLTMDVGEDWVNAKSELKNLKAQLKLKESEIGLDVRDRPEEYGLAKATEASVQQVLQGHPEIVKINDDIFEMESIVDILSVARTAIADRKEALSNLQQLVLSGLYSSAHPKGIGKDIEDKQEKVATARQRSTLPTKKH